MVFIMQKLIKSVNKLKRSPIKKIIDSRIKEFKALGKKSSDAIFNELCFCLLTANFNAQRSIMIQNEIKSGFSKMPVDKLAKKLKLLGHRFPNMRAKFIVDARKHKPYLPRLFKNISKDGDIRQWLAENVKGLGYKEASHFLRNTGRDNCAIIDFHIIDILMAHGMINKYKSITEKNYLEIEQVLKRLAKKLCLTLAELDLYLWYLETGKILK